MPIWDPGHREPGLGTRGPGLGDLDPGTPTRTWDPGTGTGDPGIRGHNQRTRGGTVHTVTGLAVHQINTQSDQIKSSHQPRAGRP